MTYDDWKLRSDRDEHPEEPPEETLCAKDGVVNRHPADEDCAICFEAENPPEESE